MNGAGWRRRHSPRGKIILVTGGASSGKSAYALALTGGKSKRAFVATGQPLDHEMAERIRRHKESRGDGWETAEVPVDLAQWFQSKGRAYHSIVLDCLTLWVTNLLERSVPDDEVSALVSGLLEAIRASVARVVIVTNELGLGLVPMDAGGRRFRELAGRVNQQVAEEADEVYLVVSGLPVRIKSANISRSRKPR